MLKLARTMVAIFEDREAHSCASPIHLSGCVTCFSQKHTKNIKKTCSEKSTCVIFMFKQLVGSHESPLQFSVRLHRREHITHSHTHTHTWNGTETVPSLNTSKTPSQHNGPEGFGDHFRRIVGTKTQTPRWHLWVGVGDVHSTPLNLQADAVSSCARTESSFPSHRAARWIRALFCCCASVRFSFLLSY